MRKREWKIWLTVLGLAAALLLGGCGGKNDADYSTAGSSPVPEDTEYAFLDDGESAWKDNTLDDLRAVLHLPVSTQQAEGEQAGAGTAGRVLGEGGCVLFKNHLFGYGKDWSGANGITAEGEEFSCRIEVETDPRDNRVGRIGPVSGGNGYAAYRMLRDGEGGIWLYALDGDFRKVSGTLARLDGERDPSCVMGDAEGNFHLTYPASGGRNRYVVLSPEGEEVFRADESRAVTLHAFGGGRVALCAEERQSNGMGERRFYEADLRSGELRELAVSKKAAEEGGTEGLGLYATPAGDDRILWCTLLDLREYDAESGEARTLYRWSSHGILPEAFEGLTVTLDGSVEVLYRDADGLNFLLLKPTEEREEMISVVFAVSPAHANRFLSAAAHFNKRHPSCNVTIRTDWDETALLTRLGAGDGPVIVDTALTGFEELEGLWQPLDGFLEQSGLADEIIPEALEFGKIGGVTRGVVRDFRIRTLVVSDSGPEDWNYATFLDAAESAGTAPLTNWYGEARADRRREFLDLLANGTEDNYYFDAQTGETVFGTPKFKRVLKLAELAGDCPPAEGGRAVGEGEALCEAVDVYGIQDAVSLRRRLEANGERIIGYPTADGGRNLLVSGDPIAIRSTATDEEKQIAYTFLKLLLSRESYGSVSASNLPVRRDALEDKFENYKITVSQLSQAGGGTGNDVPELDDEKDAAFLENLIRGGTVQRSFPAGLQKVFDEEFGDYLAGRIDGRALDEHLKSRVWLYLEESK